jgi:alkylation response protein AidB-like acyl-CoA dehydrogenase
MHLYRAPRRDMEFVLHEVLGAPAALAALGRPDLDRETLDAFLEAGAGFAENVVAPLDAPGDETGARFADGRVSAPAGYREAYQRFRGDGWAGWAADREFGGQAIPAIARVGVGEMLCASSMAWRMVTGLSEGAALVLSRHASPELRARFLHPLVVGEVTGTMCLTEAQAGTDLALVRTRAEPAADGSFRLTGTKIFISWGEHDITDNILHLVLARMPDAPPGTRGLSLFLVPKLIAGSANGVTCLAIEEKLGLHGSPTCVLSFEAARGYLVGEPGQGLACMFTMMNHARLGVALQGVGVAERAHQASLSYANERQQGRGPEGAQAIVHHPDVRRMLLSQRVYAQGGRLLLYEACLLADRESRAPSAGEREHAATLLSVLVPILKAQLSELCFEATSLAVQIHGGAGYLRASGVEQLLRDARIQAIYEGTNGVQALDLLGRKIAGSAGTALETLIREIERSVAAARAGPLAGHAATLATLLGEWRGLTASFLARPDPVEIAAAASDYLAYSGYVLLAWSWLRAALVAETAHPGGAFYAAKRASADFYYARILPRTAMHAAAVRAGAASLMRADALG